MTLHTEPGPLVCYNRHGDGVSRALLCHRAPAVAAAPGPAPFFSVSISFILLLSSCPLQRSQGATSGDGLLQRRDLLAAAPRLAARRRVATAAPGVVGSAGPGGAARLVAGEPGQPQRPGEKGGPATGPNPTDRGKLGSKHHVLVERQGIPSRRSSPPLTSAMRATAPRWSTP